MIDEPQTLAGWGGLNRAPDADGVVWRFRRERQDHAAPDGARSSSRAIG
ncbi:MAG: hypothetical protein Q8K79_19410 [Solirubrobacteraceae bacterium]|nr:hypothetical protein [Solirubrobacteraceae bacterium]